MCLAAHSVHMQAKWKPSSHEALVTGGFCFESQGTLHRSQPPAPRAPSQAGLQSSVSPVLPQARPALRSP